MKQLVLDQDHWDAMRVHVEACRPLEGCGVLAGKGDTVSGVLQMTNQAKSRTKFRMDPVEQIQAFNWIEASGLELLGIYHSHPAGPEEVSSKSAGLSATDLAEAAYPVVQVVWSRPNGSWQAHAYWIENGQALDVKLHITRST